MQSLLKEIHDSISLVETNRTDNNLSKIEKTKLEETLITLTNMERTIINETNTNMQSKLSASTPALTELINDMASSTEKLDELNKFDGCFLTGTAAEVTPVSQIGDVKFTVVDMIKKLDADYSKLVNKN
jgi:hypothetical protein